MQLSIFQWVLVAASILVQAILLAALVRLKFRAIFPVFFSFVAFNLLTQLLQAYLIPHITPIEYYYLFWTIQATATVLVFGVMYEVFLQVLKPYAALVDFSKLLFRWALLFLLIASVLTGLVTTASGTNKVCAAVWLLNRSAELMQCGLLLLLVLFQTRLGLSWRNPAVCIMWGAGLLAAIDLSSSYIRTRFPNTWQTWDIINALAWLSVNGVWVLTVILAKQKQVSTEYAPNKLILQRWNEALLATPLVRRNNEAALPVESFLPGVERAVERVMARRISS